MLDDNKLLSDRQRIISALTAARIEKGLSQQALADIIGTKRSNICRMESGAQNISLDMLLKVAKALGKDGGTHVNSPPVRDMLRSSNAMCFLYSTFLFLAELQFAATSVSSVVSGLRLVRLLFKELVYQGREGNTPCLG